MVKPPTLAGAWVHIRPAKLSVNQLRCPLVSLKDKRALAPTTISETFPSWFTRRGTPMIKHLPGPFPTRSRAVIHEGHVHAVSFVTDKKPDMYLQTKSALAHIDATLREAGTDKSRILTAIVYIADMKRKPEMNRAWDEWADRNSPPMRACLAVTLEGATLVEIVVTAVV